MKTTDESSTLAERFFRAVLQYPKLILSLSILILGLWATQLPHLIKDTRSDAFLAADNPALVYKEKVKEQFGLADPMVIAVVNESRAGIYNPASLLLVDQLTEAVLSLDNIDPDRVVSLSSENNIYGTTDGMEVEPFFNPFPETQADADRIKQAITDFPLYHGTLVADNGQATLIVAELMDEKLANDTYHNILQLIDQINIPSSNTIHVAGEGAVSGYMGSYIDSDAARLNPIAGLVITLMIIIAFRRFAPALIGNLIIAASVLITLAVMATSNTPFYVITNALPVILIGISVADAIHIFSEYYERQSQHPHRSIKDVTIETMVEMWRPVTLTTLTTMAGFLGLYFAAYMPPFKSFGLFAALGVCIAWIYSLLALPAALLLMKPKVHISFIKFLQQNRLDIFSKIVSKLGEFSLKKSQSIIFSSILLVITGVYAATHLRVDEDRIDTFHASESIHKADRVINRLLDGSYNLDIVIESTRDEGLFEPTNLKKMEALQNYAESLATVNGSTSIVDYLKQMNRSLNNGSEDQYILPSNRELVAQYFLLYTASSDPTDFEEEVDYDYRIANIRLNLNTGQYSKNKVVVEALQSYIDAVFDNDEIKATLSGRVNVNYHWIKDLGISHFAGAATALFLVFLISAWLFRSLLAGLLSLVPVASSLLVVYTSMVLLDITLGIGTSMFASVAIGLGVDFAIHTIDRLRSTFQRYPNDEHNALMALYPSTGRALFFNFLAIAGGFGVLISSKVIPLTDFGTIVAVAVFTSFITSMTLLPALIKTIKPKFIYRMPDLKTINQDEIKPDLPSLEIN